MTSRGELTRTQERALYAYVFDEDVSLCFRHYCETTRRERFRDLYASTLRGKLQACFPLFIEVLDGPTVAQVVKHRIEMRDRCNIRMTADYYADRCAAVIADHPHADLFLELLRIERATFLATHEPQFETTALLENARELDTYNLERKSVYDVGGLHYVQLRTSLKESIPTMPQGTRLFRWAVRLPNPRHSVVFAVNGRAHHRLFSSAEELATLIARISSVHHQGGSS